MQTLLKSASLSSLLATWQTWPATSIPKFFKSLTVCSTCAALRLLIITLAPSKPSRLAIAKPILKFMKKPFFNVELQICQANLAELNPTATGVEHEYMKSNQTSPDSTHDYFVNSGSWTKILNSGNFTIMFWNTEALQLLGELERTEAGELLCHWYV